LNETVVRLTETFEEFCKDLDRLLKEVEAFVVAVERVEKLVAKT